MAVIRELEEAVEAAERFLDKYHPFRRLEKVERADGAWVVEFDVTVWQPTKIVHIRLDAKSGSITEYRTERSQ